MSPLATHLLLAAAVIAFLGLAVVVTLLARSGGRQVDQILREEQDQRTPKSTEQKEQQ